MSYTPEQIEQMREALNQHDVANRVKWLDLNNPPREPYRYQEYPRMLYKGTEQHVVANHAEFLEAKRQGWQDTGSGESPAMELGPDETQNAMAVESLKTSQEELKQRFEDGEMTPSQFVEANAQIEKQLARLTSV